MIKIVSETSNTPDSLFDDEDLVDGQDEVDSEEEQEEVAPKVTKATTKEVTKQTPTALSKKPSHSPKTTTNVSKQAVSPSPKSTHKNTNEGSNEGSIEGLRDKYINTSQGIDGYDDFIYLPNGERVAGIWRLVDAFSVTPSHDPFTFHPTKGFPTTAEGRSVNTRDYYNEQDAQKEVIRMAGGFDGRALGYDTAIVVTKDGIVVSGNNRAMSSKLAARNGTDKKYIEALLRRCRAFGFTPEQVQAFEHPRVVFEIDSQDYSPEHFDKYNQTDKKEQSEEARIVKFSKVVKPNVLRELAALTEGFTFASPTCCENMINIFVKNGVISQAEVPKYFDGNKMSSAGKQFLYEYVLGGVLNESVIRALYGEGMGNIKLKVMESAYLLLENWACGSYSVVDELNKAIGYAIAFTSDLDNKKFVLPKPDKGEKQTPEEKLAANMKAFNVWASQGDLYEDRDPVVMKLAGALVFSAPLFKEYLTKLNIATASAAKAERETQEAGNAGLFGEDYTPNRSDLLQKAVASWLRRHGVKRNIMSSAVGGVSATDPVQLFSAVKALYDSGRVSRQVVESGFRMVRSSVYRDLYSGKGSRIILSERELVTSLVDFVLSEFQRIHPNVEWVLDGTAVCDVTPDGDVLQVSIPLTGRNIKTRKVGKYWYKAGLHNLIIVRR